MADAPYVTVAEMRAQGVTVAMAADARVTEEIQNASDYFELQTYMFFNLRSGLELRLNGTGTTVLELPAPAQTITSVTVDGQSYTEVLDPSQPPSGGNLYISFNDRESETDYWFPHLEMYAGPLSRLQRAYAGRWNPALDSTAYAGLQPIWPWGRKNVKIIGNFGFVEADSTTPTLVKKAIMRLVMQHLKPLAKVNPVTGMLQSETIGSYSYSLGGNAQNLWGYSVDPVVAGIINQYRKLEVIRSV